MVASIASRDIFQRLQQSLAELGFEKSTPQTCCTPITADVRGWIGLNIATDRQSGSVDVGPMFGVHSVSLHSLIARLRGEKYVRCNPPTIVQNAGFLMPDRNVYIAVRFEHSEQLTERVNILRDLVLDVGLPFMRRHDSLAALYSSLSAMKSPSGYEERMCALAYLLGDNTAARQRVTEHVETLRSEHPVLQQDFEKFAGPFLELLAASPTQDSSG